ncbi:tyrosine-type recombinase/integrase [Salidesulfovibrio brasiliensis]
MISLGTYPVVGLKQAREARDDCRQLLRAGIDPSEKNTRAAQNAEALTFEQVGREWLDLFSKQWSAKNIKTVTGRLQLHVFPAIGAKPIAEIVPQDILRMIQSIAARGSIETARRVRGTCSQIFRYAIPKGIVERDPAGDVKGVLPPITKTLKHHAALTAPKQVGELMRAIDGFKGSLIVKYALQVTAYTFLRSSEVRKATWAEIDFESAEWRIPPERMKANRPHVVPLARQVIDVLRQARPLARGSQDFIFPGIRSAARPLSENTLNVALRRLGYTKDEMTAHGFRGTASTLLYENGWPESAVERQLAHIESNQVRAAYDHAKHMSKRREMMQWYADYLDRLRDET